MRISVSMYLRIYKDGFENIMNIDISPQLLDGLRERLSKETGAMNNHINDDTNYDNYIYIYTLYYIILYYIILCYIILSICYMLYIFIIYIYVLYMLIVCCT